MKETFASVLFILVFSSMILSFSSKRKEKNEMLYKNMPEIEKIVFEPNKAVEIPFDSIFKSYRAILLQVPDGEGFVYLARTDSFFVTSGKSCMIFDLNGKFLRSFGRTYFMNFYADNRSVMIVWYNEWIKYDLKGRIIARGLCSDSLWNKSLVPLNESSWLFYSAKKYKANSLRIQPYHIWTTDNNLKITDQYQSVPKNFPTGLVGYMQNLFETEGGIFITDRVRDTIYQFTTRGPVPVYRFDTLNYKYYRTLHEPFKLEFNEMICYLKLVTTNAVLFEMTMNNKKYFIYYDRIKKTSKTIRKLTGAPADLLNNFMMTGNDKHDRQYWRIFEDRDTLKVKALLKSASVKIEKLPKNWFRNTIIETQLK
jgi:hypothetical protein